MIVILNIFLSSVMAAACVDEVYSSDKHTLQTMSLDGGKRCTLRVSPRDISKTQRKFILNNNGLVMVFIDQPRGTARNTGSHTYHIVPVANEPGFTKGERPTFKDSSGLEWHHNRKEWMPHGCEVTVGDAPSLENKGAYKITRCEDRFVIDSGFLRGETAIRQKDRTSTIIGPNGKTCTVTNAKIFDYADKDEPKPKLRSSSEIKSFLRLIPACAHLLEPARPAATIQKPTT